MIKLTDIKKLRNNKYIVTIEKDDKLNTYVFVEETIIKFNLLSPRLLTKQEFSKIITNGLKDELYEKALHYIDYQMRSISEVKKHLGKTTKDDAVIDEIITKLKKQGYLNDASFVKEFVTQKIEFDLVGPRYIKDKLIQKGIHYDIIDNQLMMYKDEIQFDKVNELILKETKFPIKKPYKKAYISIKTKLVNKGFSLSVIESAMLSKSDIIKETCLEEELLLKELDNLQKEFDLSDYQQKDKVISKLMQKGFDYKLIKKNL